MSYIFASADKKKGEPCLRIGQSVICGPTNHSCIILCCGMTNTKEDQKRRGGGNQLYNLLHLFCQLQGPHKYKKLLKVNRNHKRPHVGPTCRTHRLHLRRHSVLMTTFSGRWSMSSSETQQTQSSPISTCRPFTTVPWFIAAPASTYKLWVPMRNQTYQATSNCSANNLQPPGKHNHRKVEPNCQRPLSPMRRFKSPSMTANFEQRKCCWRATFCCQAAPAATKAPQFVNRNQNHNIADHPSHRRLFCSPNSLLPFTHSLPGWCAADELVAPSSLCIQRVHKREPSSPITYFRSMTMRRLGSFFLKL